MSNRKPSEGVDARPLHGGDLYSASAHYGVDPAGWLDLSTGINPLAYPCADIPASAMQRLPYPQPEFLAAAQTYYGTEQLLPVAGSQAAIYLLPQCLPVGKVLLPDLGYREHDFTWAKAGVARQTYRALDRRQMIGDISHKLSNDPSVRHLVVINPNNPTGVQIAPEQLRGWAAILADRGGCLVVDEAFIDITPLQSVITADMPDNIVVLRSFGKFFGLAGLRLGFVVANRSLLDALAAQLPGWQVNGVAQAAAIQALRDTSWQRQSRLRLLHNQQLMTELLAPLREQISPLETRVLPLFTSLLAGRRQLERLHDFFARAAVLTRLLPVDAELGILRLGALDFTCPEAVERVTAIVRRYRNQ